MSARDRDRLQVLHEVGKGQITQKEGGEQLGVTERWVRTLVARMRKEGDGGIRHRLRGRASNRKIPEKTRRQAVGLVRARYGDFGPTLAREYLAKREGIAVSQETSRCRIGMADRGGGVEEEEAAGRGGTRVAGAIPPRGTGNWCSGTPPSMTHSAVAQGGPSASSGSREKPRDERSRTAGGKGAGRNCT